MRKVCHKINLHLKEQRTQREREERVRASLDGNTVIKIEHGSELVKRKKEREKQEAEERKDR